MRLTIRLDPNRLRQWHLRLAERLARRPDTRVAVDWSATGEALPSAVPLLFSLERLIYRLPGDGLAATAGIGDFAPFRARGPEPADLVLDLCGAGRRPGERTWQLTFDATPSEAAAIGALMQSRKPVVAMIDLETGAEIAGGRPGAETNDILVLAFEDVLARTMTLVKAALDGAAARTGGKAPAPAAASTRAAARFAMRSLAGAAVKQLYRLCYYAPHWRVGWRWADGPDLIDLRAHPDGGWRELPDDGVRFYADPFPIMNDGRLHLFVEEFDHRMGRGAISVVEFGSAGPIDKPRQVLATPTHLSYPFVFQHRREMWMVPESSSTASIDIYRAAAFPDRWVKEATLVPGTAASDATLFQHDGRWWMLATVRDGGAHSDALHAWSAADPLGPWRAHDRNPVLVDIACARPAGRVVRRGGKLIRPFQDCSNGYGSALGLAAITRLDDGGFAQQVETMLHPGPAWPGRRLHTLNRAGPLECIDGSAQSPKFWTRARGASAAAPSAAMSANQTTSSLSGRRI
jgi:hypothetical protein